MLKVLFHIDTLSGGGAEKVLCTLVNHMNPKEFDITVQTIYPENAGEYLNNNIHYKYIYPKKNRFYGYLYRLEAALGLIYPLHMKADYDVECAYLECGPTKVLASSTNKKARKYAWVHCDLSAAYNRSFAEKTAKWYRKYDKVICVSEKIKESFADYFGSGIPTEIIHNVVDSEEILRKSELVPDKLKKTGITMVNAARLTPPKNLLRLLKAQQKLLENGIDVNLWIVGEGEDRKKLEQFIAENDMGEQVTLWGYQQNPYPFMKAADLLVCSSNYEGFSTFVTEGLILGKPILTTDCSGMKELLGDSEYGIVTENSDEAFYNGLRSLLQNKDTMLPALEAAAQARGRAFTAETLTRVNEEFLRKGTAGNGGNL